MSPTAKAANKPTGEIHNPIFRVVARFFMGYHATMDAFHKALGAKFGEQVSFD